MHVLPATGWCGLAGTCFPRDKPDLRESKETALEGEVKSWERQRERGNRKEVIFISYAHPFHSLHCIRSPASCITPGQCNPRCGSDQCVCKPPVTSAC